MTALPSLTGGTATGYPRRLSFAPLYFIPFGSGKKGVFYNFSDFFEKSYCCPHRKRQNFQNQGDNVSRKVPQP
jgi:hypothetical protein